MERQNDYGTWSEAESYKLKPKFGYILDKYYDGNWSFGVCITRDKPNRELYLFMNMFKFSISIGWFTSYKAII